MKYLEKNSTYKDKKKNVGARVSEVVLSALNNAESDSNDLGYTFSITRIIEKALQDTLEELSTETGMDYLALEKFKFEMNERQGIRNINAEDRRDFEEVANSIKLEALNDSSVDMNLLLINAEKKMTDYWDKYVINRKEKKVRSELEKLTESNQRLNDELNNIRHRDWEEFQNSKDWECQLAHRDGWGDFYDEALEKANAAYDKIFDEIMKKNNNEIQKQKKLNDAKLASGNQNQIIFDLIHSKKTD